MSLITSWMNSVIPFMNYWNDKFNSSLIIPYIRYPFTYDFIFSLPIIIIQFHIKSSKNISISLSQNRKTVFNYNQEQSKYVRSILEINLLLFSFLKTNMESAFLDQWRESRLYYEICINLHVKAGRSPLAISTGCMNWF